MSEATKTPATAAPPRRVVTGLDADGRSCVQIDGPAKTVIWSTKELPADNSGDADTGGGRFRFPTSGADFVFSDFPPRGGGGSFMHATDTLDFLVVVFGEVTLITETGETLLKAGDVLVDRGVMHGWRNDSDLPCRIVNVLLPAHPVGPGATVAGELDH
ncbi:cupin domain-containing protein [Phenylobacterium sp. LjRoot219]|uniref:cupin domain-containing protein n=1 Tax=Phenylobacterium sp. LjRoot219 TaxID=3342283 RepID=UPI003ED0439B